MAADRGRRLRLVENGVCDARRITDADRVAWLERACVNDRHPRRRQAQSHGQDVFVGGESKVSGKSSLSTSMYLSGFTQISGSSSTTASWFAPRRLT